MWKITIEPGECGYNVAVYAADRVALGRIMPAVDSVDISLSVASGMIERLKRDFAGEHDWPEYEAATEAFRSVVLGLHG